MHKFKSIREICGAYLSYAVQNAELTSFSFRLSEFLYYLDSLITISSLNPLIYSLISKALETSLDLSATKSSNVTDGKSYQVDLVVFFASQLFGSLLHVLLRILQEYFDFSHAQFYWTISQKFAIDYTTEVFLILHKEKKNAINTFIRFQNNLSLCYLKGKEMIILKI